VVGVPIHDGFTLSSVHDGFIGAVYQRL
jgi:hypothetical protein